jgi:hypothetical protein
MKNDIDFDELDRAVNSLMGTAKVPEPEQESKQNLLSINSTLKNDESPNYDKLSEAAKRIGSETLVVEDESSSVKSIGEIAKPRPEVTPVPVSSDTVAPAVTQEKSPAEVAAAQPDPDTSRDERARTRVGQRPQPSGPAIQRPSGGRFMDVVHPSSDMKTPQPMTEPPVTPEPSAPEPLQSPQVQPSPVPDIEVASPFLPDAKVEKRPLGGASKDSEQMHSDAPEEIVAINAEAVAREEATKDTQAVLDASKIDATDSLDKQIQAVEAKHSETAATAEAEALRAVESVDTGTTSKQGAIFDVKEYHQPLQYPEKRKSGWGIVVIIVIIIVLAAAVGVGTYFLLGLGN